MASKTKNKKRRKIAQERVEILFSLAQEEAMKGNKEWADRYVKLARRIAMRCNISISRKHKRKFCKYCYSYLFPDRARVRTNPKKKRVEIKCLNCKEKIFFPYAQEVKQRRKTKREP